MSENLMKAAVLGGLAGVSGLANVVDEMYLKKSLGFKKRDSAQSAFVRGAAIGAIGLAAVGFLRTNTTALDMFGLGAPMHTKDRKDESADSHKARMPHVSKKVQAPDDYIWVENADSRYLVIDPKYAL